MNRPIVYTNILFVLVATFSADIFVIFGGLILTLGSGWMHYDMNHNSINADWIGMFAFPIAIIAYLVGYSFASLFLIVLLLPLVNYLRENNVAIAIVMLSSILVKLYYSPIFAGLAGITFLLYLYVHHLETRTKSSTLHTWKHVVGALGYLLLIL